MVRTSVMNIILEILKSIFIIKYSQIEEILRIFQ